MPSKKQTILPAIILVVIVGGGLFGYYKMRASAPSLPTYKVARGDLDLMVRARGEIKAQRSVTLSAPPRIGDVQIVQMIPSGTVVAAGQDCIEIDATSERDRLTQYESNIRQLDANIERLRAQYQAQDEDDQVTLQSLTFNVRSAQLDVKKAEVQSVIDGEKAKLALADAGRKLADFKVQMDVHQRQHAFMLDQMINRRKAVVRDYNLAQDNIQHTLLKAPISGIFQALTNRRMGAMRMGGGGQPPPEFKQGDRAFPGASIGEIPDLTSLAVELAIDETDRGRIAVGQTVRLRVDAFADSSVIGKIETISPLSQIDRTTVPPARTFRTVVTIDLKNVKLGAKKTPEQVAQNQPAAGAVRRPDAEADQPQEANGTAAAGGELQGDTNGRRGQARVDRTQGGQRGGEFRQRGEGQGGQRGGEFRQRGEGQGGQASERGQGGARGGFGNFDPAQMEQMRQRFQNMSPEERQAMASQFGGRGGRGGRGGLPAGLQQATAPVQHLKFDQAKAATQTAAGDVGLRPGMSTTADIVVDKLANVVLVPVRATFDKAGRVVTYVKKGSKFEPREIVLGYKSESQVQVVSGLQPGDMIALEEPAEAKGGK